MGIRLRGLQLRLRDAKPKKELNQATSVLTQPVIFSAQTLNSILNAKLKPSRLKICTRDQKCHEATIPPP